MAYKFDSAAPYRFEYGALFLGLDHNGQEIGYETEIHALTVGGSGTGKGAGLLVTNARRWLHNLFVIDPKGENATLAWEAREGIGHRVAVIDPFGQTVGKVPDRLRVPVNPLADIDAASPRARPALLALGSGLVVSHDPRHMEWTEGARTILAGLCAFVVADAPPEMRTFGQVREILMQRDDLLLEDAETMAADSRLGGLIRSAGSMLVTALTSEKGMEKDFLGTARRATQWLDDEAIAESLGHSDFRLSDLKTGLASLFLVLPPDYIANYSAFLRLFVKAALHEMGKPVAGERCLFLLDEFYSLGKLEEVAEAAGRMRSMGVTLWPFVQGLGQLHDLYGKEGAQTFMTNAAVHCFLGNDKDGTSLNYISRTIGNLTPEEIRDAPPPHTVVEKRPFWSKSPKAYSKGKKPVDWDDGFIVGKPIYETEGDYVRRTGKPEEIARAKHEAADENARRQAQKHDADARAAYDHDMKRVGQPRLTPEEIAELIGKDEARGDIVARSMIVFLPAGKVLNLKLAPYFLHQPKRPRPDPKRKPAAKPRMAETSRAVEARPASIDLEPDEWEVIPMDMQAYRRPAPSVSSRPIITSGPSFRISLPVPKVPFYALLLWLAGLSMLLSWFLDTTYAIEAPKWVHVAMWAALMAGLCLLPACWENGQYVTKNAIGACALACFAGIIGTGIATLVFDLEAYKPFINGLICFFGLTVTWAWIYDDMEKKAHA